MAVAFFNKMIRYCKAWKCSQSQAGGPVLERLSEILNSVLKINPSPRTVTFTSVAERLTMELSKHVSRGMIKEPPLLNGLKCRVMAFAVDGDISGPSKDTLITDIVGKQLPAEDVFGHSILYLKNHATEKMKMQGYDFDELDIRWVLPVPEVWTEAAKQLIREAAQKADIKNDRLMIVLESYAASLFCRHNFDAIKKTSQYIVVDLGGGKADFTVFQVVNDKDLPKEYRTQRKACRGTMVDVAYEHFFISIVGKDVWEDFRSTHWGDYLEIFRDFEMKKRTVKRDKNAGIVVRYPVTLRELYERNKSKSFHFAVKSNDTYSKHISLVQDKIRIGEELMKDFYSEPLNKIIVHLQGIVSEPVLSCLRTIILVGGFSESPIVQETLRNIFPKTRLLIPADPELTVLKGTVMFGHRHGYENIDRYDVR